jgi:hypothetical protein
MPKVGDEVTLSSHKFRVERIRPLEWEGNKIVIVGLNDVVLNSRSEAKEFATRFERELGLICDEYE